jgi:hypothetical protein
MRAKDILAFVQKLEDDLHAASTALMDVYERGLRAHPDLGPDKQTRKRVFTHVHATLMKINPDDFCQVCKKRLKAPGYDRCGSLNCMPPTNRQGNP